MPRHKVKAPRGERGAFGRPEGEGGGPSGCWGTAHGSNDTGACRATQVTYCNSRTALCGLDRPLPHEIRIQYCAAQKTV